MQASLEATLSKWSFNPMEFDPCPPLRSHYPNRPDPVTPGGKSLARFAIISSASKTSRVSSRCLADKIRLLVTYCYSSIISVNKWISVSRLLATTQEHKFLMQNWSMSDSLRRINHGDRCNAICHWSTGLDVYFIKHVNFPFLWSRGLNARRKRRGIRPDGSWLLTAVRC